MIEISKAQFMYIKKLYPDAFITVCSKRKHGGRGYRKSGKTYYCPEVRKYVRALQDFNTKGGGI